jgi:prephenate dehydratase
MEVLKIIIGFLGPSGTFTEEALNIWIKKLGLIPAEYKKVALLSISDIMNAVGKTLDAAIVPVENSLEGSVNITVDSFIRGADAMIKGEVILPITQHLLLKKIIPLDEIKEVLSHPQALFQCREFIKRKLPLARLKEVSSTAEAAKFVSESEGNIAAIGSKSLSKIYGLTIAAERIQDSDNNMTRFYVLSTEDEKATGRDKTTMIFSTENKPGSLFRALKVFAERGLNLTKIESRPSRRILGEYVFLVEIEGHRLQEPLKSALIELEHSTSFLKILGSYPIFEF